MELVFDVKTVAGVALLVTMVVQAIKLSGVTNGIALGVAPWVLGALACGLAVASGADPVTAVLVAATGTTSAVLGYNYALRPAGQAIGLAVSSEDLE
jgi:hypothetical protein